MNLPAVALFLGLGLLALTVLIAGERVRGALLRWERSWYASALRLLASQRDVVEEPEGLLAAVDQVLLDLLGEPAGLEELFDVRTEAPLTMTFRGGDRFYTFTPQPERARALHPRGRWFVVDALTAHPDACEELAAAFAAAVRLRRPGETARLPRSEQWGLVIWQARRSDR